jgi:23S rRNA pseudouridine2605 synthase
MQERLQKILSQAGVASRRESENFILDGRVAVNGVVVTELGTKADADSDIITVDGKPLVIEESRVYILLYKPVGYMTTMKDPEGRPIVTDLLKGVKERVYPIGRLDYNTEGLLLLTNDGALANMLMHPSHEVDKGYLVRVSGKVTPEQMKKLAEGVQLEDGMTAPAKVLPWSESENNTWISITIHEGRYRQVRRMCEAVGLNVVRLKRARYDFLEIGEMHPGDFRLLEPAEVTRLNRKWVANSSRAPQKTGVVARRGSAPAGKSAGAGRGGYGKGAGTGRGLSGGRPEGGRPAQPEGGGAPARTGNASEPKHDRGAGRKGPGEGRDRR